MESVGEKAITTTFRLMGYCRRTSKKKDYSDNPVHKAQRVAFAQTAIRWTRERVYNQVFSDEVWAMGGRHTTSYVTVKEDESDRYVADNVQHNIEKPQHSCFMVSTIFSFKNPAS